MDQYITLITFSYQHEVALVRGLLEDAGIQVFVKDELTAQVQPFYSNAIGGIKVLVRQEEYEEAREILQNSSFSQQLEKQPEKEEETEQQKVNAQKLSKAGRFILIAILLVLLVWFLLT